MGPLAMIRLMDTDLIDPEPDGTILIRVCRLHGDEAVKMLGYSEGVVFRSMTAANEDVISRVGVAPCIRQCGKLRIGACVGVLHINSDHI